MAREMSVIFGSVVVWLGRLDSLVVLMWFGWWFESCTSRQYKSMLNINILYTYIYMIVDLYISLFVRNTSSMFLSIFVTL
jgi:hypothetical protein